MSEFIQFDSKGNFIINNLLAKHPSLWDRYSYSKKSIAQNELMLFREGFCLIHSYNIKKIGLNRLSKVWVDDLSTSLSHEDHLRGIIITDEKLSAIYDYKNVMDLDFIGTDIYYQVSAKRIILSKDRYNYLMEKDRLRNGFKKNLRIEREGESLISLIEGNPPASEYEFEFLESIHAGIDLFIDYYIEESLNPVVTNHRTKEPLKDIYSKVAASLFKDDVLIPYNQNDRAIKYKDIYIELAQYMQKYEE